MQRKWQRCLFVVGKKNFSTLLFASFLFLMADENFVSPQGQVRYVNLLSEMWKQCIVILTFWFPQATSTYIRPKQMSTQLWKKIQNTFLWFCWILWRVESDQGLRVFLWFFSWENNAVLGIIFHVYPWMFVLRMIKTPKQVQLTLLNKL